MQQNLNNTKIDVAGYAKQYGITLEQAHNEIQPWLFEHNASWACGRVVINKDSEHLYVDSKLKLGWDNTASFFRQHHNKQLFLERKSNIVLTIKQQLDIIDIDGKSYDKQSVMNAIKNFEITE